MISSESFKYLISRLPFAAAMLDNEMKYLAWSDRWLSDFGIESRDLFGVSHYDLFQDIPDEWRAVHKRCLAGAVEKRDHDVFFHTGARRDEVNWSILPWRRDSGGIGGLLIFREVTTERRRAAQQLRETREKLEESEARFQAMFQNSPDAQFVATMPDGRIIELNDAFVRIFGFPREELIGRTTVEMDIHVDLAARERLIGELIAMGRTGITVLNGRRRNGEVFMMSASLSTVTLRGQIYSLGSIRDISVQRRTEDSRMTLAAAVEASHDFIAMTDLDGNVTYLNDAARTLIGAPLANSPPPMTIHEFYTPEEREAICRNVIPVLMKNGWVRFEASFRHLRTGRRIPVEVEGVVVRNGEGQPFSLTAIARDLTERREAETVRNRLESRLAQVQRLEAVGRLTAAIAHDFNNLLAIVLGHADLMLMSGDPLSAEQTDGLQSIRDAGTRARDLIGQLMGFSGQQVIIPQPLSLNQVLANSEQILTRLVGEDIRVRIAGADDLWEVFLDAGQVDQVLMNLAANARDAMPGGGQLTLETSNIFVDHGHAPRGEEVSAGDYVQLAVRDNGSGMNAETVEQIFEPFFTTKEKGSGTGLGLATVYGIVRQNRGFVTVESAKNQGTTFRVCFPRFAGTRATASPVVPRESGNVRDHGVILLIEDNDTIRGLTARFLLRLGYTPLVADSPAHAIAICSEPGTRIDMAISDVIMPGMNGGELRDRLVRIRPALPVLFVSGYTADVLTPEGVLNPDVQLLRKPFSPEDLSRKIREMLGAREPAPLVSAAV